ncbi:MAG: single-stranded DNA-binding protein [Sphaerochaeta sp.]|nr:single-stranded DNA-binding protein [Sphaerochaeta sp.]
MSRIIERTKQFSMQLESLNFSIDCYIYNPLEYAWAMHEAYLRRFVNQPTRVLLLGMNPGPFGMAQTGVPFGEVAAVKGFLGLDEPVGRPVIEHPKRPILGLETPRSEVSGRRLWGLLEEHYGASGSMGGEMAVVNYCPLVFVDRGATGRNITPDKLIKVERLALEAVCDRYLLDVIALLRPSWAIGVGKYAHQKLINVANETTDLLIGEILHPSPANPAANRGWAAQATEKLKSLGVW